MELQQELHQASVESVNYNHRALALPLLQLEKAHLPMSQG